MIDMKHDIFAMSEKKLFRKSGNIALKALGQTEILFSRVISIGDIHGCIDSLKFLIESINVCENDLLVFLGDYVDRGPDSPAVIEYLLDLDEKYSCVFLRGNHDSMMLSYLQAGGIFGEFWTNPRNGGDTTLKQYNVSSIESKYAKRNSKVNYTLENIIKNKIPESHIEFLQNTFLYFEMDHAFYSHAGFDTMTDEADYDEQSEEYYTWTRNNFLYYLHKHKLDKLVVHGHTITNDFVPYYLPDFNRINLDSGCFKSSNLSAFIFYPMKSINESSMVVSNVKNNTVAFETITKYGK